MRHRKSRTKLSRNTSHRKATLSMLAKSLIISQEIKTTKIKAKEACKVVEKLITVAKEDSVQARRKVYSVIPNRTVIKRLFSDIAPLFRERKGGYTRIIPLGSRRGDGADMVILEFVEKIKEDKTVKKKKTKAAVPAEKNAKVSKEKDSAQHKAASEITPEKKEEKVVEDVKKDKARKEEKKVHKKSLFKKFFKRRTSM